MAARGEWNEVRRRVDDAVMVLFALVTRAIGGVTGALLDQDLEQAEEVIESYAGIGDRCDDLSATVKERLSTRCPNRGSSNIWSRSSRSCPNSNAAPIWPSTSPDAPSITWAGASAPAAMI